MSSCSVYKASTLPPKKDLTVFRTGTPRAILIGEFGQPITTTSNGQKTDVFKFTQGYSKAAKTSRAFFHGAADVLTLGMWEVMGTPAEMVFDGTEMAYQVEYDEDSRVSRVSVLKGN